MRRQETTAVTVPAGVIDGHLFRIPQGGHHGPRGGPPGDLVVTCRIEADPRFERRGPHLVGKLPLSVSEAILGARVPVLTLADDRVLLRVPPGTGNAQQLRLRGHGLEMQNGRRGDLIFVVELWLPETLDEDAKRLIREFGERTPAPARTRHATVRK